MKVIRRCVFETNSSSTHSISIVSKEEFELWKDGEVLFDEWSNIFVKKDEIEEDSDELKTYKEYFHDYELENYTRTHTTKSGDVIVAFGKYGYNS